MTEREDIGTAEETAQVTPAQRIRADWKALLAKVSYLSIVSNIPYLAFVALLCMIYIANSHRAVEMQRELNKENETLKELRWRYMDIKTRMMNAGMEAEVIRKSAPYGLKPLALPAYSIVEDSSAADKQLITKH
jgi:hypothetical protein